MKKIVLIGFSACYKSTVGQLLADMLNCAFLDTDKEIERSQNLSVQQIFDTHGEQYFRALESLLLNTLNADDTVVACGGGSVLSSGFGEFARDSIVVWLTAQPETVHARLGKQARPLFDGLSKDALCSYMQQRAPLYAKYAHISISTDNKTSQQVAEQVFNWLLQN